MESRLELVTPAEARAAVAAHVVAGGTDAHLGEILLAEHQVAATRGLLSLLAAHGGALLADDVGLGKTYVALSVARRYASAIVVAPACLRGMWQSAARRAGVQAEVTSYQSLSRGSLPTGHFLAPAGEGNCTRRRVIILDEAHHARSTRSRRYPRIAALTAGADTLLLTATPLPNRLNDLRSLIALFAGSRAWAMSETELTAVVYRRTAAAIPSVVLPDVARPRWIDIQDDTACLDALLRLPPMVPPAGGGDAGALVMLGLVRQWASSRAALVGALRRLLARSLALRDSVAAGHMPTAIELRTWCIDDDTMQLAFPELIAAPVARAMNREALSRALCRHGDAVSRLLALLVRLPDPDVERARRIATLQEVHPGEKIVCFTDYAETAAVYWGHLRIRPGVARLSARGGQIASGHISRDAVLQRFAPEGQRVGRPAAIEEITTLIATDILAEGVDLRDATVVVHLDLPWSPARMEQRVGRARRMGSLARCISVYAMRPPAPSESVLALENRLRQKIAVANAAVGSSLPVLPHAERPVGADPAMETSGTMGTEDPPLSEAERRSSLIDRVVRWSDPRDRDAPRGDRIVAAIVPAPVQGWLAAATVGKERLLVASLGNRIGSDPALVDAACNLAEGADGSIGSSFLRGTPLRSLLERAVAEATRHAAERAAAHAVMAAVAPALAPRAGARHATAPPTGTRDVRRRVLARIHQALVTVAPDQAPRITRLAAIARRAVTGRLSAGLESRLQEITSAIPTDDAAWLAAVGGLADDDPYGPAAFQLRAIIAFAPTLACRA